MQGIVIIALSYLSDDKLAMLGVFGDDNKLRTGEVGDGMLHV